MKNDANINLRISKVFKLHLEAQALKENRSLSNHIKSILLKFNANQRKALK
jgi:hypothetical protein